MKQKGGFPKQARVVYRANNNANANGGVSYANANNDAANVNANIGSRLANNNVKLERYFGVQQWGRVLEVVPMGMNLSKSVGQPAENWKTERDTGFGRAKAAEEAGYQKLKAQ